MTVDEYERVVAAGALDDPKIELLDGYLVKKNGEETKAFDPVGAAAPLTRERSAVAGRAGMSARSSRSRSPNTTSWSRTWRSPGEKSKTMRTTIPVRPTSP